VRFWTFFQGLKIGVPSGCLEETSIFKIIMIDDVTFYHSLNLRGKSNDLINLSYTWSLLTLPSLFLLLLYFHPCYLVVVYYAIFVFFFFFYSTAEVSGFSTLLSCSGFIILVVMHHLLFYLNK